MFFPVLIRRLTGQRVFSFFARIFRVFNLHMKIGVGSEYNSLLKNYQVIVESSMFSLLKGHR